MRFVGMRCHKHLVVTEVFFSKPQGNLVSEFGSDRLVGMKGLRDMIEHSAVGLAVVHLGVHHLVVHAFGNTVDARHEFSISVSCFTIALAVGEDERKSGSRLRALTFHNINRCHPTTVSFREAPSALRSTLHIVW